MNREASKKFDKILQDKTSGSSEILANLNRFFVEIQNPEIIKESVPLIKNNLGKFSAINEYLIKLSGLIKNSNYIELDNYINKFAEIEENRIKIIFEKFYTECENINKVITLSRSGTILNIIKHWVTINKKLKFVVCESRPALEGRLLAKDLIKSGVNTELITDAMMSIFVPRVDAAVIGADAVLKNGNVVNKMGSKALALFCKEYKKPFYVVTSKSKYSKRTHYKPEKEDSSQIWNYKNDKLSVTNFPFEEIEKKLITKIFTN